jgi:hypothetical protein
MDGSTLSNLDGIQKAARTHRRDQRVEFPHLHSLPESAM